MTKKKFSVDNGYLLCKFDLITGIEQCLLDNTSTFIADIWHI